MAKQIKITQFKSGIGALPLHKRTLEALGFRRCYQTLVKNDTPQLRGVVRQVRHLGRIEDGR